jgi:hypothetical protein
MTTNQTIDGVPRELLERCARELSIGIGPAPKNRAQELRALLDAETVVDTLAWPLNSCANCGATTVQSCNDRGCHYFESGNGEPAAQPRGVPVACAHEWTDDGEFTLTCTKCGKTENHEPYGWVQTRGNAINHFTQEWDVVESWEDQGFEYKAMFDHAEQPAPVAVVLPTVGPEPEPPEDAIDDSYMDAHNAAIRMRSACLKAIEAAGLKVAP